MQRLGRTSSLRDIHIAQVETLIKDKEGNHKGDFDETNLLTCIHDPALTTVMALQINQLKEQLQNVTTVPLGEVCTCMDVHC